MQNKQVWLISIRPIVPTSRLPVFRILQIKVTHLRILVTGGVKSGKSRLAEKLALSIAATELPIYLATTEFTEDPELQQRIALHQQQRAERFVTIEEGLSLHQKLPKEPRIVLVECLTMWLNNLLHHGHHEERAFLELEALWNSPHQFVLVLNEVGLGIVPTNQLARRFADLSGRVGQWLGDRCDQVFFCAAGLPLQLK